MSLHSQLRLLAPTLLIPLSKFALLEFKSILSTLILSLQFQECEEKPEIIGKAYVVTVSATGSSWNLDVSKSDTLFQKPYLRSDPSFSQLPLQVSLAE